MLRQELQTHVFNVVWNFVTFLTYFFFLQGREKGEVEIKDGQSDQVSGPNGESKGFVTRMCVWINVDDYRVKWTYFQLISNRDLFWSVSN